MCESMVNASGIAQQMHMAPWSFQIEAKQSSHKWN